jgi:hypothetical protein
LRTLAVLDIEVTGDVSDASRAAECEQRSNWISERLRQELGNRNIYTVLSPRGQVLQSSIRPPCFEPWHDLFASN